MDPSPRLSFTKIKNSIDYDNDTHLALLEFWLERRYGPLQGAMLLKLATSEEPVTRTEMAKSLWPEDPRASEPELIRYTVYKIRQKLEEDGDPIKLETLRRAPGQGRMETAFCLSEAEPDQL